MKTHWNPAAKSTSSSTIKSLNKLLKLSLLSLWKIIFLLVDISLSKITIKIAFYHSKIIHDKFILPRCSNLRKKCFIFFVPFHWWNDVNSFQPIANCILTLLCIPFSKRWKRRVEKEWSLSLYIYIHIQRFDALSRVRRSVIREKKERGKKWYSSASIVSKTMRTLYRSFP